MPLIYTIEHPTTNKIVYVGKTQSDLKLRLRAHLTSKGNRPINIWIASLKKRNLVPIIKAVEVVEQEEVSEREMYWITTLKDGGAKLLNISGYVYSNAYPRKKSKNCLSNKKEKLMKKAAEKKAESEKPAPVKTECVKFPSHILDEIRKHKKKTGVSIIHFLTEAANEKLEKEEKSK